MSNDFHFKKFSIAQDCCAMKVGTDGVVVGAWANGGKRIMDIGTGTGLIALMMAQRFPTAIVDAVEIDEKAAEQAKENVARSPFANRVNVIKTSLQDFQTETSYDSIVTNPPFFINSLMAPDPTRSMARHTVNLSFSDIFSFAINHLTEKGEISAIIPIECIDSFSQEGFIRGMFITRQCIIKTVERKPAKRCLIAFSKSRPQEFEKQNVVLTNSNGERSNWYNTLTSDFYL